MATSLSSLLSQTSTDHEQILRAADARLNSNKSDLDTQHVKVVALLKLDRYRDAVRFLQDGSPQLRSRAALDYAYALYKDGDSLETARIAANGSSRDLKHVLAQAQYKNNNYQDALQVYKSLVSDSSGTAGEQIDLKINISAVNAQLHWTGKGSAASPSELDRLQVQGFESLYNDACVSIANHDLVQAETQLHSAKELCESLDDMTEEEKQAETLQITVQLIYVLSRLGKTDEARSLISSVRASKIQDPVLDQIATFNHAVLDDPAPENPYLSQKLREPPPRTGNKSDTFSPVQQQIQNRNSLVTNLQLQKFPGLVGGMRTPASVSTLEYDTNAQTISHAAAHVANESRGPKVIEMIADLHERYPDNLGLVFLLVQLYAQRRNYDAATRLIERFVEKQESQRNLEVRYAPGLTALLVALYTRRNQHGKIRAELSKSVRYWQSQKVALNPALRNLYKAAGHALMGGDEEKALTVEIFGALYADDATDPYAKAGLSASSSSSDKQNQKTLIKKTISSVDVAALEKAGLAHAPPATVERSNKQKRKRPAAGEAVIAVDEKVVPAANKRIKSKHLPRNLDRAALPDPERWMPMRDRTSYKAKTKKKAGANRNKASQGAVSGGAPATGPGRSGTPGVVDQSAPRKKGKGKR